MTINLSLKNIVIVIGAVVLLGAAFLLGVSYAAKSLVSGVSPEAKSLTTIGTAGTATPARFGVPPTLVPGTVTEVVGSKIYVDVMTGGAKAVSKILDVTSATKIYKRGALLDRATYDAQIKAFEKTIAEGATGEGLVAPTPYARVPATLKDVTTGSRIDAFTTDADIVTKQEATIFTLTVNN